MVLMTRSSLLVTVPMHLSVPIALDSVNGLLQMSKSGQNNPFTRSISSDMYRLTVLIGRGSDEPRGKYVAAPIPLLAVVVTLGLRFCWIV